MTETEKADHPSHETTKGYLRKKDWKEEWRKAFETASPEDIQAVRDLPAFDYDVFEEITGLDLRTKETEERRSYQMAVRMKPRTRALIESLVDSEGVPIVEIFERAIAFYAKKDK